MENNENEKNVPAVKRKKKVKKNIPIGIRLVLYVMIFLIVMAFLVLILFSVLRWSGRKKLYLEGTNAPDIGYAGEMPDETEQSEGETPGQENESVYVYQEGDVNYNGQMYRYNKDMLTILILGIDSNDPVPEVNENTNYLKGGQSDAIFLFTMNPHDKTISVVAVNRNTMTDIDMYDKDNNYVKTVKAQLCVQHGYGDGNELSCERAEKIERVLPVQPHRGSGTLIYFRNIER